MNGGAYGGRSPPWPRLFGGLNFPVASEEGNTFILRSNTDRRVIILEFIRNGSFQIPPNQLLKGQRTDVESDVHSGFVFSTKNGNPIMPSAVNNLLLNIVNKYNSMDGEIKLPHISAHNLRHTGCTRMAEAGIDQKVLQHIMGHSKISVTMEVYNHISSERNRKEIDKLEKLRLTG